MSVDAVAVAVAVAATVTVTVTVGVTVNVTIDTAVAVAVATEASPQLHQVSVVEDRRRVGGGTAVIAWHERSRQLQLQLLLYIVRLNL